MSELPKQRWFRLMRQLGLPSNEKTFDQLVACYQQKHRRYHNATHIVSCLTLLDQHYSKAKYPAEVEIALWFHDAIYKTLSSKNEKRSAQWLETFLKAYHCADDRIERCKAYVLATQSHQPTSHYDSKLFLDIDLAILGAEPQRFSEYDQQIYDEYRWVSDSRYWRKRYKILNTFLERETLYFTPSFQEQFEEQAKTNLKNKVKDIKDRHLN